MYEQTTDSDTDHPSTVHNMHQVLHSSMAVREVGSRADSLEGLLGSVHKPRLNAGHCMHVRKAEDGYRKHCYFLDNFAGQNVVPGRVGRIAMEDHY